jgi:hypothetical protein
MAGSFIPLIVLSGTLGCESFFAQPYLIKSDPCTLGNADYG